MYMRHTDRFIAGVILTPLLPTFERLLWRICQGNVFVKHETISFGLFHPEYDVSHLKLSGCTALFPGRHISS